MAQNSKTDNLKVAFQTYGCRSNYADTIELQAGLSQRGAISTQSVKGSDVIVVNTCSVTDTADREAFKFIQKAKRTAPNARIVVTGCLAELDPDGLNALEEVDVVVGPGQRNEVLATIFGDSSSGESPVDESIVPLGRKALPMRKSISLNGEFSEGLVGPGDMIGEVKQRSRYHLRIQEGCENSCTFCVIPFTRGRLSSRPIDLLRSDIEKLADLGYQEVVLTGTHIGGFGEDRGESLLDLLKVLERDCPVPRLRLSSIDPNDLSSELLDFVLESDVFCEHLHICIQAFSDNVLKRMNRRYRMEDVRNILCYISQKVPEICIGTDVITGFPGESRQEVDQGVEEFLRLPISYLHVFPYSERSGTAATRLDGSIDIAERRRRSSRWRSIAERKKTAYYDSRSGAMLEVVVERQEDGIVYGTSREYIAVKFAASENPLEPGTLVCVEGRAVDTEDKKLLCQLSSQVS